MGVQGSGWSILAWDTLGQQPIIVQLYDQQGNLPAGIVPLLMLDVWEHAYYLDYQNVRADYVKAFWTVTDWANVSARFEKARDTTSGLITL
jgi:Fe-Mn family superoxide dismutase